MKRIKIFENFKINEEILGIAHATTFYTKRLTYLILEEIYKHVDEARPLGRDVENVKKVDIILNYKEIKNLITSEEFYDDFPVSEIILTLKVEKAKQENVMSNGIPKPYMVGGSASPFAKGREKYATRIVEPIKTLTDHSLSVHFNIDFIWSPIFRKVPFTFPLFENTKLFKKIESVINHELNHLFEQYKRKLGGSSGIQTALTWASIGENTYGVTKEVFDFWQNEFTEKIYNSEPHEVRAQIQEAKTWVDRMSFQRFKKECYLYEVAREMRDFNVSKFLKDFSRVIVENKLPETTVDHMRTQFIQDYKQLSIDNKEIPTIDPWKLEKYSSEKFFHIFEKKIKEAGENLIRRYARLYALKDIEGLKNL